MVLCYDVRDEFVDLFLSRTVDPICSVERTCLEEGNLPRLDVCLGTGTGADLSFLRIAERPVNLG